MTQKKIIYIIAGEPSGDNLGAKLISALKASDKTLEFHGIGGPKMEEQGVKSLFPIQELSLMGFFEIIPHLPNLISRMNQTINHIQEIQPDMVITIDSPGFNFRIAKKLNKAGLRKAGTKLVHYVAPTVWAYKPKRAEKISKLYDHILLLLPFEPPFFDKVGLRNTFVGHPVVEDTKTFKDHYFRKQYKLGKDVPLLALLPGSRLSEINRHIPVFLETIIQLQQSFPRLQTVWVIPEHHRQYVRKNFHLDIVPHILVSHEKEKSVAFHDATAALCKSGTISLELANYNLPMVVTYKVNPLSAMLIKIMLRCKYVSIVNLLLGKMIIPELLQSESTPDKLSRALKKLLKNPKERQVQTDAFKKALSMLGKDKKPNPATQAAHQVLELFS